MPDIRKTIFIETEQLERQLSQLDSGMAVTHGHYETSSRGLAVDLDWNHMDPHHRQYIHHTYGKSVRLCTGPDFQLSLTKFGRWPLLLPVADIRIRPGLFYQCFSVFSLASVIAVLRTVEVDGRADQRIDWFIVSKRIWKFLHPWLNRRMEKLNRVQNAEDVPVRERRFALRQLGFRFKSDPPDYVISSSLAWHLLPPKLESEHVISLKTTADAGSLDTFTIGTLTFLYSFDPNDGVQVWPEACPHEGGPLSQSLIPPTNGCLKCPWHGLEIRAVHLTKASPSSRCQGVLLRLNGSTLVASPSPVHDEAAAASPTPIPMVQV